MVTFTESGQARLHLVCLAMALSIGACARPGSKDESASAGKPSAAASVSSARPPRSPLAPPKPAVPPITPNVAPQIVVCRAREFYRITQTALQAFDIAAEPPPPNIRGSRVSKQIAEAAIQGPLNLISTATKGVLVIATSGVFRYELGQKEARRYGSIPVIAPLVALPDQRRADTFRVRALGDASLREYSLAGLPSRAAGAPPAPELVPKQVEDLPGFDMRLFTLLADGTPLYSTPKGLMRRGDESPPIPFYEFPGPTATLFADPAPGRYWAADPSGRLALFDTKGGTPPVFTSQVPGVMIDAALDGEKVAVLSVELDGMGYRPTVTVFSNGKQQAQLGIGAQIASRPPPFDLCVIPGRPWVVVATTRWMQLLDWEKKILLAEW